MMKATDFNLAIFQAIIVTPDVSAFSLSKAVRNLVPKYYRRYDGLVETLSMPDEMPPDVPRFILQSKDGRYRLDASPKLVASSWRWVGETQAKPGDLVDECLDVLENYIQVMQVPVGRLGMVVTRICQAENPAQLLIEKFCRPELHDFFINQSEEFGVNHYQRLALQNFQVNLWMKYKTGRVERNDHKFKAAIVHQDFNTLEEELEERNFSLEEIRNYFHLVAQQADTVLHHYLPG